MPNPKGPDGLPMERHHRARQDGPTELTPKSVHDAIHEGERDVVRDVMVQDGLKGNPGAWTAKQKKKKNDPCRSDYYTPASGG